MAEERWRDIATDLRHKIDIGEYLVGARLPIESALCEQYGASNNTVRKAVAQLVREGRLTTRRGAGTFVREVGTLKINVSGYAAVTDPNREGNQFGPWETACRAAGVEGYTEILDVIHAAADHDLAERLGIQVDAGVVRRRRQMRLGERVVQIQDAWMPAALVAGTPLEGEAKIVGGVYAAMTSLGMRPQTASYLVNARTPTTEERSVLELPAETAVLETWRTTRDADGQILEVLRSAAASDAVSWVFDGLPLTASP